MHIKSIKEIAVQVKSTTNIEYPFKLNITYCEEASAIAQKLIGSFDEEYFLSLYLNSNGSIETYAITGIGNNNHCPLLVNKVMRVGVVYGATSIIVCHNHPSGHTLPSESDIDITERISIAADNLEMVLLDHIIVSPDKYTSLKATCDFAFKKFKHIMR